MRRLICMISGHRRIRRDVRSLGNRMRTDCARCGHPIAKDPRTGDWVDDPEPKRAQR